MHLWKDYLGVEHGLIMALDDLTASNGTKFFSTCTGYTNASSSANPSGSYTFGRKDGAANTAAIMLLTPSPSVGSAIQACDNLVLNGFSDWYLPSFDEMCLAINRTVRIALSQIPGATQLYSLTLPPSGSYDNRYWTSTLSWNFPISSVLSSTPNYNEQMFSANYSDVTQIVEPSMTNNPVRPFRKF